MKLFGTTQGIYGLTNDELRCLDGFSWNGLFGSDDAAAYCADAFTDGEVFNIGILADIGYLAPIEGQEIWAAGVTYYKSRDARMTESKKAGGDSFYDRVYDAERPELFYKGSARTVVGHGEEVRIRADSKWNVPEPELTLAINAKGTIIGYTIGNDMSSRDIEGENPLYLPQAKVYDASCALGPSLVVTPSLPENTEISIEIRRSDSVVFEGSTRISEIKRPLESLASYLYRDNTFPNGTYLLTGTGVVPDDTFTLEPGDSISIGIVPIGTLENTVAKLDV